MGKAKQMLLYEPLQPHRPARQQGSRAAPAQQLGWGAFTWMPTHAALLYQFVRIPAACSPASYQPAATALGPTHLPTTRPRLAHRCGLFLPDLEVPGASASRSASNCSTCQGSQWVGRASTKLVHGALHCCPKQLITGC